MTNPRLLVSQTLRFSRRTSPVCHGCWQRLVEFGVHSARPAYNRPSSRAINTSGRRREQEQQQPQPKYRRESLKPETYYDLFPSTLPSGPPPSSPFAIDVAALRREFLMLQAAAHPDRQQNQELKIRAEAVSAQINNAFKTLADPLLRAQYLLSLRGIDVAEDETAKTEDQELLMAVLEAQEAIEEAEEEEELVAVREMNQKRYNNCVEALETAFANNDIETAKTEAIRLKYWVNVGDALREWEPGKKVTLIH